LVKGGIIPAFIYYFRSRLIFMLLVNKKHDWLLFFNGWKIFRTVGLAIFWFASVFLSLVFVKKQKFNKRSCSF